MYSNTRIGSFFLQTFSCWPSLVSRGRPNQAFYLFLFLSLQWGNGLSRRLFSLPCGFHGYLISQQTQYGSYSYRSSSSLFVYWRPLPPIVSSSFASPFLWYCHCLAFLSLQNSRPWITYMLYYSLTGVLLVHPYSLYKSSVLSKLAGFDLVPWMQSQALYWFFRQSIYF